MLRVECALNPRAARRIEIAAVLVLLVASLARGDVVFDGSLGHSGSAPSAPGIDFLIEQERGQLRGTNLFHSFSEFSVPEGLRAEFTAVDPIDNVIARVTSQSTSFIDGTIASSIPGADVYLLNPNGVVFGQKAQIDVPASFHVATADALRFANGEMLVVRDLDAPVLSSFPPSAFGFL